MNKKLLIAIPTLDYIHRKFVESLTKLVANIERSGQNCDVHFEGCTLVYISRDNIVQKAIEGEYDEVLWLDADMVFEPDIYDKLSKSGKEFVTGLYRGRHGTNKPCIFRKLEPPDRWEDFYGSEEGVVEIKGCGFGCALTSVEVLAKVWNHNGTCFRPTPLLGEDLAFCKRTSDCGLAIWADCDVRVGHIGQYEIRCDKDENGSILRLI